MLNLCQILSVYYALMQSVIGYGIIGWGALYKIHRRPIENVHKNVIKIIYQKFKNEKETSNKIDNILTIQGIYFYGAIKLNIEQLCNRYVTN